MKRIKVLLVDDQVLFVKSLNIVLKTQSDRIDVVGIAYDGREALQIIEHRKPDVVFLDIRMPEMNGVECTRAIKARWPEIHVVILTTFNDDQYVSDALRFGASGYLLKDVPPEELIATAIAVSNGSVMMSPQVAVKIGDRMHGHSPAARPHAIPASAFEDLSGREKEILEMMCSGYGNREIAGLLSIAEQTVKNSVSTIYAKLGVKNRFQAVRLANEEGFRPRFRQERSAT